MTSDVAVHRIRAGVLRKRGGPLRIESLEPEGPRDDEVLLWVVARAWKPGGVVALVAGPDGGSLPGGRRSLGIIQQINRAIDDAGRGRTIKPVPRMDDA